MIEDAQGLPVSTTMLETVQAINRLLDKQANQQLDWRERTDLLVAADRDRSIMANTIAALLNIHSGDLGKVSHYLARAQGCSKATKREETFLDATSAWAEGDIDTAINKLESVAHHWPRDMYALRLCCTLKFYARKDAEGALALVRRVIDQVDDRGQAYALLSFMEEEAGLFQDAESSARTAVTLNRNLILGQHTVAHVMEAQGRDTEGVLWLEQFTDTWENLNESFNPHMWMHLGLHYLGIGQADKALTLFDDEIVTRYLDKNPAQLYGTNLLARVDLNGFEVGDRFSIIAAQVDTSSHQHIDPLSDLHHVYLLSRTKDKVSDFMDSLTQHAAGLHPSMQPTWQEVVLPTARAIIKFNNGDAAGAAAELQPIRHRFIEIGGSAVERAVFTDIWLHSVARSGGSKELEAELDLLKTQKGDSHRLVQHYSSLLDI